MAPKFPAGISRALNSSQVEALGVRMLPGYRDPFHGRALTRGEVGCFLSHFRVWQEVRRGNLGIPGILGVWDGSLGVWDGNLGAARGSL